MLKARAHAGRVVLGLALAAALFSGSGAVRSPAGTAAAAGGPIVGRIEIAHQDSANPSGSRMIPLVDTARGPVALRFSQGLPAAPGSRIEIRHPSYADGAVVGGQFALLGPPTVPSSDPTLGPANFKPGPRKVLVLLATIGSQPAPASAAAMRSSVFTAPNSANAFIQEESFGQLSLTGKLRSDGDVYGPYPVSLTSPPSVCDYGAWGTSAENQFKTATGMNAETWDNVIVVFQYPSTICQFSGVGEIGQTSLVGPARHVWVNAVLTNGLPTTSVLGHELGHNFGVDHAGGFECTDEAVRVSFSEGCAADPGELAYQYYDPFDVMGNVNDGLRQENAYHKWESGWLPSSSVQTVVRSGTYLVAPEESSSSAVQLLEVPRALGAPSYWLDFRQPFGSFFDTFLPTDPVVNGVSIRYANSSLMSHPSKSWLIDTTPDTDTFDDAALTVGRTYTDSLRGITITTVAASPLGALVKIVVPSGDDTTPPGPASGLTASVVGGAVHLSWTGASDDSGAVQHYRVDRNGVLLADVYRTAADDSAPLAGRTSTYSVTAIDPAGNESTPVQVQVGIADTTAPTAPSGLAAGIRGSGVTLSWSPAVDDVGVAWYEVDRDGQQIANGWQSTTLNDPNVAAGTHTYTVRAFDQSGNAGAVASVRVVVVGPASVVVPKAKLKTVTTLRLKRVGKHRVLVSWKATRGAHRYQVLRSGKKPTLLATVRKVQYLDGHATTGTLAKSRYVVRAVLG